MIERPSLDEVFLRMVDIFARRSTCSRRAVAAIITDKRGRVISIGYNGVPSGFIHCISMGCPGANDAKGDTRRCQAVHAEQNALLQTQGRLENARTMYCSCAPCFICAKMICNTNIERVVVNEMYEGDDRGVAMLKEKGVEVIVYGSDEPLLNIDTGESDIPY